MVHVLHWFVISSFILMMRLNCALSQSWTPIYVDTSNRLDLWTVKPLGCDCPDGKSLNCACCNAGGCLCPSNHAKCAQCGLEEYCQRPCNVTISARAIATRSGLSWVHLQSPEMEGPTACHWKFFSAPGQRIEIQIHRIISVGSFDNSSQTCKDGFLQFADGDTTVPSTQAINLCGKNSRFSPPVVLFGDQGLATLYLKIEGKSSRSQVLAYVSFSSADDPSVGDPTRGGLLRPHSVCDWTYDNCFQKEACVLSSPGFPGLFPPHRKCRYFLTANSTTDKILIKFQSLNIPPPPLCSHTHIAIWKMNVNFGTWSSLAHLGPPWKTLCQQTQQSDSSVVEVDGGQALIEFRSGTTTSPNLYNGFLASVEFVHTPSSSATLSPKRVIPTIEPKHNPPLSKTTTVNVIEVKSTEMPIDEPLGYPRSQIDDQKYTKSQTISCGHIIDGSITRGDGFRLKISKKAPRGESTTIRKPFHCQITFRGKDLDIVQLALHNYKLRGSNCSSQIEVYDVIVVEEKQNPNKTVNRLLRKLCGPSNADVYQFKSTFNRMSISIVISTYDTFTGAEFLEGAFQFHDESIGGTMKPQSACEVAWYGMTSSPSGSVATSSALLRLSPLPIVCSYSFHPAQNQSILLTLLNTTGHDTSEDTMAQSHHSKNDCTTLCSTSGCWCETKFLSIEEIDHFTIVAGGFTQIACFCGSLANVLPVVFESDNSLALITHQTTTNKKVLFNYTTLYKFIPKKSRFTNFSVSPPSGWKRWKEIMPSQSIITPAGSNAYKIYDLTWPASVPVRSKLSIELLSEENEQDCKAWNLTIWAEDDKLPNRSYLVQSFCPGFDKIDVKIPDSVRNAFIKLQGVSVRVPQFQVRWKYLDAGLSSNRNSEKMMSSDKANNTFAFIPKLIFAIISCIITRMFLHIVL